MRIWYEPLLGERESAIVAAVKRHEAEEERAEQFRDHLRLLEYKYNEYLWEARGACVFSRCYVL